MSVKMLLASGIAALALTVSAGAAFAAPRVATATTSVRSGPGASFRVVDRLFRGDRVNMGRCRGAWCFVTRRGPDGWVNSRFLSRSIGRPPVARPPVSRPPVTRPPSGRPPVGRPRSAGGAM